jgi:hypothetical protein
LLLHTFVFGMVTGTAASVNKKVRTGENSAIAVEMTARTGNHHDVTGEFRLRTARKQCYNGGCTNVCKSPGGTDGSRAPQLLCRM